MRVRVVLSAESRPRHSWSTCMPMLLVTIGILLIVAGPALAQAPPCPGHLVSIARDGSVASGSKDALREAVRRGAPLRVGWAVDFENDGKPDVTHWADA